MIKILLVGLINLMVFTSIARSIPTLKKELINYSNLLNEDTVWLNLKAYSKQLTYYSHDYSNDIFIAGNYVSEKSQFKIVIQLVKKQSKLEPIYFFVNSIENDSVIVGQNITCGLYEKVQIIEAKNCQFRIVKVSDNFEYVVLEECRLQAPDIKLYNNRIPEIEIEGVFEKKHQLKFAYK